jgi:hypothetical protein
MRRLKNWTSKAHNCRYNKLTTATISTVSRNGVLIRSISLLCWQTDGDADSDEQDDNESEDSEEEEDNGQQRQLRRRGGSSSSSRALPEAEQRTTRSRVGGPAVTAASSSVTTSAPVSKGRTSATSARAAAAAAAEQRAQEQQQQEQEQEQDEDDDDEDDVEEEEVKEEDPSAEQAGAEETAEATAAAAAGGGSSSTKQHKKKRKARGLREAAALQGLDVQTFKKQRRSGNTELDRLLNRDSKSIKLGWGTLGEPTASAEKRTLRSSRLQQSGDESSDNSEEDGEPRRSTRLAKPRQVPNISGNEGKRANGSKPQTRNPYFGMGGGSRRGHRGHSRCVL